MNHNPFKALAKGEWALWIFSLCVVGVSSFFAGGAGVLSTVASLTGVTALIFVAKGDVYGQLLTIIFSLLYGVVSIKFHYWGELITYVCMSLPAAFITMMSWLRHPYKDSNRVEIAHLTKGKILFAFASSAVATVVFYFILRALSTPNLAFSTLSVFTSFLACVFLVLRLPYYALAYSANDVVLIVLWVLATLKDVQYLPMIVCFSMFLVNDLYGFYNWRRMKRRQSLDIEQK
ncbi:MAG: nicotinamide mononucleotide transporter [Eubacterium sp.]|nr:nicotinamide mononucleotide transporter [Eubacterium sp.]